MVWQRARSEEQKQQRKTTLLEAAARLHRERPLEDISLSDIAREANLSKANVYRYFESREELFLDLTLESLARWRESLLRRVNESVGVGDVDGLARALTLSFLENERFARLASVLSTVLERKVSAEKIVRFKTGVLTETAPLFAVVSERFPAWTPEDAHRLMQISWFLLVGMWPAGHPPPAVKEALARPELAMACVDFERDYAAAIRTAILGLQAGGSGVGTPR